MKNYEKTLRKIAGNIFYSFQVNPATRSEVFRSHKLKDYECELKFFFLDYVDQRDNSL